LDMDTSDSGNFQQSYLRFKVGQYAGIVKAELMIFVVNESASGAEVVSIADSSWSESQINWNNKPSTQGTRLGVALGTVRKVWLPVDVTAAVVAGKVLSLAMVPTSSDGFDISSRESGARPQLVLTLSSTAPAPDSGAPPPPVDAGTSPAPVDAGTNPSPVDAGTNPSPVDAGTPPPPPPTGNGVWSPLKAFPTAEGYGTNTRGGRGGSVCVVTNLNDSGTGSLRSCVGGSGPRIVVFKTGGTINLQSRLTLTQPFITIAGQTAPGDGITLRMAPGSTTDQGTIQVETHDVVIRFVRFRPGDNGFGDDSHDGIQIYDAGGEGDVYNIVVDHCSVSWAIDENVNTYDASHEVTISWSIISEALSNSTHPQGEHSKGQLSGGVNAHNVSIHHNLFASNVDRNPQISGLSIADIRNNVIYNYGNGSGEGTTLISSSKGIAKVNWIGNYYKPGPSSPAWNTSNGDFAMYEGDTGRTQSWYGSDNKHLNGTSLVDALVDADHSWGQVSTPFAVPAVATTSAAMAYDAVLAGAGASRVRDDVDLRILNEVRTGTGGFKSSAAGLYPTLATGSAPADSDNDGMPNDWETARGLNPAVNDSAADRNGDGYTNIEEYLNLLAP
jgi:pectate lyase